MMQRQPYAEASGFALSAAIRSNVFNASGSYASSSKYRTRRPTLWLRTSPRNVTTAPSAPRAPSELSLTAAINRPSSSDAEPIARS